MKLKDAYSLESYDQPRQHIKKQRHSFVHKCLSSQGYGFSSSHVWMWALDHKESWAPKNWCFWVVALEKTWESLGLQGIQPVHPKGDQSWVFIGRTDVGAETPLLWPPDTKSWLIWKDPHDGKDWGQEEKGMTEDEIVGCHHWLNGHEFGYTLEVGDGQGGLSCCDSWGCKVGHDWVTELNWTELMDNWLDFFPSFLFSSFSLFPFSSNFKTKWSLLRNSHRWTNIYDQYNGNLLSINLVLCFVNQSPYTVLPSIPSVTRSSIQWIDDSLFIYSKIC